MRHLKAPLSEFAWMVDCEIKPAYMREYILDKKTEGHISQFKEDFFKTKRDFPKVKFYVRYSKTETDGYVFDYYNVVLYKYDVIKKLYKFIFDNKHDGREMNWILSGFLYGIPPNTIQETFDRNFK